MGRELSWNNTLYDIAQVLVTRFIRTFPLGSTAAMRLHCYNYSYTLYTILYH
jgi:hypothetical protein